MTQANYVFLSYARADDEPFVKRLRDDLVARGRRVWWDKKSMESRGRTFLQELRDAVEGAERVLAVIGPAAVASPYVRVEWDHALQFGKGILPVLRAGKDDLVPRDLAEIHYVDFRGDDAYDDALAELTEKLATPVEPLGEFRSPVPSLPPNFVARSEETGWLTETVLADIRSPVVVTPAQQTTALHGMGCVGKSVVAAAFARAAYTRRAFSDGIVWIPIGRESLLLDSFAALGAAFRDDPGHYLGEETARVRMPELLADRACLIVLDDVWSVEQVSPFRDALGPRCRLLLTTRDEEVAASLGAQKRQLEELTDDAALTLLAQWGGYDVKSSPDEAAQLVKACGNLPLPLAQCGAMVAAGSPWADLLEALAEADIDFLKRDSPNYKYRTVFQALQVSIDALEKSEPVAVQRLRELAVFPPDQPVPEAAVMSLWLRTNGIKPRHARLMLTTLQGKSLLRLEGKAPRRTISQHALQYDYLVATAEGGLSKLHTELLDAYGAKLSDGWATAPDDGYIHQHLSYHLIEADRVSELVSLLTRDPAWMKAKSREPALSRSLLVDLERAMEGSSDAVGSAQLAALRVLVHTRAESYGAGVLAALVWLGRTEQALISARMAASPLSRLNALYRISQVAAEKGEPVEALHGELLRVAEAIAVDLDRAQALRDVGVLLAQANDPRAAEARARASDAARAVKEPWVRATTMCELAEAIGEGPERDALLDEAWEIAEPRLDDHEATSVQADLAAALAAAGRVEHADRIADAMTHESWGENARVRVAAAAADADRVEEARRRAGSGMVADSWVLPRIAAAHVRAGSYAQARKVARSMDDRRDQAEVFRSIASALAKVDKRRARGAFTTAWNAAKRIDDPDERSAAFCELAVALAKAHDQRAGPAFDEAKSALEEVESHNDRYTVILGEHLALAERFDEAIETVGELDDDGWRGELLGFIGEALARRGDARAAGVVEQAINAWDAARDDREFETALGHGAGLASLAGCHEVALEMISAIGDTWERLTRLIELGQALRDDRGTLAENVIDQAVALVPASAYACDLADLLRELAGLLVARHDDRADEFFGRALDFARTCDDEHRMGADPVSRTELANMLNGLGDDRAAPVFDEAEKIAREADDPDIRARALAAIAGALLESDGDRAEALLAVARTAAQPQHGGRLAANNLARELIKMRRIDEAQAVAEWIEDDFTKSGVQVAIVDGLCAAGRWDDAWSVARAIDDDSHAAEALINVGLSMVESQSPPERLLDRAVELTAAHEPCPRKTNLEYDLAAALLMSADARAAEVLDSYVRSEGAVAGASLEAGVLAWRGSLSEALRLYSASGADEFLLTMIEWARYFEDASSGGALDALRESIRIVGWARPDWAEVHAAISESAHGKIPLTAFSTTRKRASPGN
jgi:hypothetical protein